MLKYFPICFLISFCSVSYVSAQCVDLFVIRHAEKGTNDPKDPDLSEKGEERAETWSKFFEYIEFDKIYTSPLKRTHQTAEPTANKLGLKIESYQVGEEEAILKKLAHEQVMKVLWVGHSNTIPMFVGKLMNKELEDIEEENFGQFWQVTYCPNNPEWTSYQIFQLP
jgi:2,3-bisphosphoglycerate-dependent phosphoglycerate mutase